MKCPKCGHRRAKGKECKFCKRIARKKYDHSPRGRINHVMRHIRERVSKGQVPEPDFEFGELLEWSMRDPKFQELYLKWKDSGFRKPLGPSLDRRDSRKGYYLSNVQWMTWDENRNKNYNYDRFMRTGNEPVF